MSVCRSFVFRARQQIGVIALSIGASAASAPAEAAEVRQDEDSAGPQTPDMGNAATSSRPARVRWPAKYRRVGVIDYSLTALGATTAIVSRTMGPAEGGPSGGIWFDDHVRAALRASSEEGRNVASRVSDVLWIGAVFHGLVGDPWIHTARARKSPDAAYQIFWMNAEVAALTLGIQQATSNLVGRERPYGRECPLQLTEDDHRCAGRDRYRSIFSGHTSVPFAIAAATCMHHAYLPLSGRAAWLTCATGLTVAATTGTLRVVSDKHYATDVLVGAALGTLVGLSVPWFHYATGVAPVRARMGGVDVAMLPFVPGAPGVFAPGLGLLGTL